MNGSCDLSSQVSILIPTINRSLFVIRALHFYKAMGFKGWVCVGDSSGTDEFCRTQEQVNNLSGTLNIIHKYFPTVDYPNEATVVKSLVALAPTRFVCQYGDDDFLIPSGIVECVQFLNQNEAYIGACGRTRIEFTLQGNSLFFGEIGETVRVDENDFDKESAKDRFMTYMRNAVAPTYNVYRKEVFEEMYKCTDIAITRYFGPEVLVSAIAALVGKTKCLNVFTVMFQVHEHHIFGWNRQSIYDKVVDPTFSSSITVLREQFVDHLIAQDGLSRDESIEIVDRELWRHINKMMSWQYKEKYSHESSVQKPFSMEVIKRLPGISVPVEVSLFGFYWWIRKLLRKYISRQSNRRYCVENLGSLGSIYLKDYSFLSNYLLAPPAPLVGLYNKIDKG